MNNFQFNCPFVAVTVVTVHERDSWLLSCVSTMYKQVNYLDFQFDMSSLTLAAVCDNVSRSLKRRIPYATDGVFTFRATTVCLTRRDSFLRAIQI
jgi:hypothetical protein